MPLGIRIIFELKAVETKQTQEVCSPIWLKAGHKFPFHKEISICKGTPSLISGKKKDWSLEMTLRWVCIITYRWKGGHILNLKSSGKAYMAGLRNSETKNKHMEWSFTSKHNMNYSSNQITLSDEFSHQKYIF